MNKPIPFAKEALTAIQEAKHILLHFHPKPDPDSVGSALATYHALRSTGKEVDVIKGESDIPNDLGFLPGFENVIAKNYFETDLSKYDLFIIQDSASKQLISRLQEVNFPANLKTLVLDHHASNKSFGDINIVDPTYASTTELLYDLFTEWNIPITKDIAACLFIGLYSDTGGFRYSSTTPRTMHTAAKLTEIYPDFTSLIRELDYNNTKERMYFDGCALSSIETFFDGTVALTAIPYEKIKELGVSQQEMSKSIIPTLMTTVKGWEVGTMLTEREPGIVSISLRSRGKVDVSKIAGEIGGGGHKPASGATLKMSLDEAKKTLLTAIEKNLK